MEARKILLQVGGVSVRQAYSLTEPVLVELYSPPRLTEFARRSGWGDGLALDLTTCDENGEEWDFTKESCRERAKQRIEVLSPDLLLGCPPCHVLAVAVFESAEGRF